MGSDVLQALSDFLAWPAPLFIVLGVLLGTLFGFLPGLGGAQALALLTPVTYGMEVNQAIGMLVGVMGAVPFGGSISAILLNTPGTPQNAATTFDGFPLTQQGKAGYALGASASSSMLGAVFGVIVLMILLPLGRHVVLAFSYPEYFMMAFMGISVIAVVSKGSIWKGLTAGVLGLLLSSVGFDPASGDLRYTFGTNYLYDGIRIVPALIGLFSISSALELMLKGGNLISGSKVENVGSGMWSGILSVFKNFSLFIRCSVIGTVIGIIPGVGGAVSNFLAYGHAVQTTQNNPRFGKGDIRGVIAPQAADTAKDGGALIPTVIFGIPGSVETAVLLGSFILHGMQPGPRMLLENPTVIYVLVFSLLFSNVIAGVVGLAGARYLARLTEWPVTLVAPMIIALSLVGAYASEGAFGDVVLAVIFGILGFFMNKFGFSTVPLVIALVLGELAQETFHQTLMSMGVQGFFVRPISLGLFILTLMMLIIPFVKGRRVAKKQALTKEGESI